MKRVIAGLLSISLVYTGAFACDISYKEITTDIFDYIGTVNEDLAAVKKDGKDGKYGYINTDGKLVIDYIYDFAGIFSEGLAIVKKGRETGFIKKDGTYTMLTNEKTKISEETMFYNGYVYINTEIYGEIFDYNAKKIIFDSINGNSVKAIGSYGEGYFPVAMLNKNSNQIEACGFADDTGKIIKKFASLNSVKANENIITFLYPLDDGLAAAYFDIFKDGKKVNNYWGFIDKNGEIIIKPQYKTFRYKFKNGRYQAFSNGLVSVQNNRDKFGAINKKGEIIIPFNYEALETFNEGLSPAKPYGNKYYDFIDTKGKQIIDGGKYKINKATSVNNKLAIIYTDDLKTLVISPFCEDIIVKTNKEINDNSYFYGENSRPFSEYDIAVKNDKKILEKAIVNYDELISNNDISHWAYKEVKDAINTGIVPSDMQNMFTDNISREDFAVLVMKMLDKKIPEKTQITKVQNPFKDTANIDVIRANNLGLINGVGNSFFEPYSNITREDASVILKRAIDLLKINYTNKDTNYNDNKKISSYASSSVNVVSTLGIMKGVGANNFAPKDFYSREQAMITIFRLYNK